MLPLGFEPKEDIPARLAMFGCVDCDFQGSNRSGPISVANNS